MREKALLGRFFKPGLRSYSTFSQLGELDKINTALSPSLIDTPELAFYQGLGFLKLGKGYEVDALHAFKQAILLDKTGQYKKETDAYIAQLTTKHNKQESAQHEIVEDSEHSCRFKV